MGLDLARVQRVLANEVKILPKLQANMRDPIKDRDGGASAMVAMTLHCIGVCEYLLVHDVRGFQKHLADAARLKGSLFDRHDRGEPMGQKATLTSYADLFLALASGEHQLSLEFARRMGGRDELEAKHDNGPFVVTMGNALRAFTLNDKPNMDRWLPELITVLRNWSSGDYRGYGEVFAAVRTKDLKAANRAFDVLVRGHLRQCRPGGDFGGMLDEFLFVWGIGMANLCRWHGLPVDARPPLIPNDLLVN